MDKKTYKSLMKLSDGDFIQSLRSHDKCEIFVMIGMYGKDKYITKCLDRAVKILNGYREALKWALDGGKR